MTLFVILYVWQNIEIVKIEMECQSLSERKKQLADDNDRLRYDIERYRRMDVVEAYARKKGMRQMQIGDFDVMTVHENDVRK
ncbi:MAG: hypothetical protein A2176_14115 [Spirochaetes bacterium RBG_13_51_14]|nr:MAG: hypothetical protein A2176_14115 [Spirochaetes bacterium RBG_13_51_14]